MICAILENRAGSLRTRRRCPAAISPIPAPSSAAMAANRTAGTHSAPRTDFGNWGKISGSAELPGSCGRYSSFGTTDDRYNKNDLESAFVPPNLPHVRILEVAADCGRVVAGVSRREGCGSWTER